MKLFIIVTFFVSLHAQPLYLVFGEAGVGKSAYVNWLAGTTLAKESHLRSGTKEPAIYYVQQNGDSQAILDTPGLFDTDGITNNDIIQLVKTHILKHRAKSGSDSISGIVFLINARLTRHRIGDAISALIQMLGRSALDSVVIGINMIESLDWSQKQAVAAYITQTVGKLGITPDRVVPIDTKDSLNSYFPVLKNRLQNVPAYKIEGINELVSRAEQYFKQELSKDENYHVTTQTLPDRVVYNTVIETVMADEAYNYECNCRRVCRRRILGSCIKRKTICDDCVGTRKVPRTVSNQVPETLYRTETNKRLKNTEDHYKSVALDRVVQEIRDEVFKKINYDL